MASSNLVTAGEDTAHGGWTPACAGRCSPPYSVLSLSLSVASITRFRVAAALAALVVAAHDGEVSRYAFDLLGLDGSDGGRGPLRSARNGSLSYFPKPPGIQYSEHLEGDGAAIFAHPAEKSADITPAYVSPMMHQGARHAAVPGGPMSEGPRRGRGCERRA
jgi:hypothetical protein